MTKSSAPQQCGAKSFVGAGLLFGRIEADALELLAQQAQTFGAAELRLTPWRAILAVGLEPAAADHLAARLSASGFLLDARDSRLAFAACPGAPACPSARGDVRAAGAGARAALVRAGRPHPYFRLRERLRAQRAGDDLRRGR